MNMEYKRTNKMNMRHAKVNTKLKPLLAEPLLNNTEEQNTFKKLG